MGYEYRTKNGYNMFDMSSMLQKAIRRNDFTHAGFAARELYYSYRQYMWKRLLVISAEDCYGAMTKEIEALRNSDELVNGKKEEGRDLIFISKAIVMLCRALKNRDACYFACNLMMSKAGQEVPEEYMASIEDCEINRIPDYVFDKHTIRGKKMGRTSLDMIEAEEEALEPRQLSLFDYGDWGQWKERAEERGTLAEKDKRRYNEFAKDRKHYE